MPTAWDFKLTPLTAFDDGVKQESPIYWFYQGCSFLWRASCPMLMGQAGPLHGIAPLWHRLRPELFPPPRGIASWAFCRAGNIFVFLLESLVRPISNPTPLLGQVSSHGNPACACGRFGRKAMLLLSLVCSLVFGMLSAASVSYTMLSITRTLTGVALSGVSLIVLPLGKCMWGFVGDRLYRGTSDRQWAGRDLSTGQGRASRNRGLEIVLCAVSLQAAKRTSLLEDPVITIFC